MYIRKIRVQNFRSIRDSGWLTFSHGFNLIVGANNVGKSSLLHCMACRFGGEPHKSIETLPVRDEPLDPTSRVDILIAASAEEVRRLIVSTGAAQRHFPWPSDIDFNDQNAAIAFQRLFSAPEIELQVSVQATVGSSAPNWQITDYPATRVYAPLVVGDQYRMLTVEIDSADRQVRPVGTRANMQIGQDFGLQLGQLFASRIYKFHAERLALGTSAYGKSSDLDPDARNLAEVLNVLQSNPERFKDYCDLVREVFPEVRKVSVRPLAAGGNVTEIAVWQVDPSLQRDDLAIPLSQCGTGIGQVLAILYIAKVSEAPRTIIIDEPGSFLHPGAARALISILGRFNEHQYIVATHSPEIISALAEVPVTTLRWSETKSAIEQAPRTTSVIASNVLTDIGARLSDVFGFDKVLWVEGQSDSERIRALLIAQGKPQRSLAILPVRDTGSFRRRRVAEVLEIYRSLSFGGALLPPAVLFLFDREGRSATEIEDAVREGQGKLRFLSRRMFENYLLNAEAITRLFNETGNSFGLSTTAERVSDWIAERGKEYCAPGNAPVPWSDEWFERVDAASLLSDLFADLSDARLPYRKSLHTPRLTLIVHEGGDHAIQELLGLLTDVIE